MSIWDEKNAAVGAQTPKRSSSSKGNVWERANSEAAAPIASLPQYVPNSNAAVPSITTGQGATMRPGPTIERANKVPFIENATISAPAETESRGLLKGLRLKDISFNKPTGLYSTDTGLPIVDVQANPRIEVTDNANFLGKMVAGAANVALGAVTGIGNALGSIFDTWVVGGVTDGAKNEDFSIGPDGYVLRDNPDGSKTTIMLPELRNRLEQGKPAIPTASEKIGQGLDVVTSAANAYFTPVAAELEAAKQLPLVGGPIFGTVSKGFELLDHASRFVGTNILNALPISQESKDVLREPIEDLAGILGTLAGVKAVHLAGQKGGGKVVESLPVSEATKGKINTGVRTAASISMQPFSFAYRGIIGSMRSKVETRQAAGEEITPEVARNIVSEAVKETVTPDLPSVMEIPTASGKTERLFTNQKLVLQNLIRGRENLTYRVVDDLGISLNTGRPITSRFEWDYKNQRGTIYTTSKTSAVDLARELGHYVDRQLGSGLSKRLSDVMPEYRNRRDEINQMLADYALDRLGGNATHAEISAEVLRIADNIRSEIEANIGRSIEKAKAKDFANTFGGVIDSPQARAQSPELAQLAAFVLGDVARKGGKPDIQGAPGSTEEAASILDTLESTKRGQVKETQQNNQEFIQQQVNREMQRQAINERGNIASANFSWRDMVKGIRDSKEFRKEGTISDATMNGVMMEKGGKFRLVPFAEVRAMQRNGWQSRFTMDEIAHANGFENAEAYTFYIMELDAESRLISRSSEQKAAHEYLMKNDPNYAKLNETIDILREQLTSAEDAVPRQEPASQGDAGRVPAEAETRQSEVKQVITKLPRELAGAKPRYNYGDKPFTLKFESDLDRAAYITAQRNPSGRDADYLQFVMDATGMTENQVRRAGAEIKLKIKAIAKNSEPGELAIADSGMKLREAVAQPRSVEQPVKTPAENVQKTNVSPEEQALFDEARKYNTPEEFIDAQTKKEYRSAHQIDFTKSSPVSELQKIDEFVAAQKARDGYPSIKENAVKKLRSLIGDPNKEVKIYRASPKNELNPGDWVTIDRAYAGDIKRQNGGRVYEYTVKAGDLYYPNNVEGFMDLPSLARFASFQFVPKENSQRLIEIWNSAHREPVKTTVEPPTVAQTTETPQTTPTPRIERMGAVGEGPRGTSKVGESIARRTIEQKLEDSFDQTVGYDKITIADQARRVDELLNTDVERARRIITGEEALPEGMRGGALIKGMEEYALKTGDAELAFELANSPLVAETSLYAQEMRLLAERTPDSATAQLRSLKKAREETAKEALRRGQTLFDATSKAKREITDAVKNSRPTKETWSSFIDSIKCA